MTFSPSCADTIMRYFELTSHNPEDFDLILTGDLGFGGHQIFLELCRKNGLNLKKNSDDCGRRIYDRKTQEVNSGGSGCGCSASVFCTHIIKELKEKKLKDILLIGTGALLNASSVLQKETIPGISHLIRIKSEG